jgi:hypothetical protein
MRHHATFDLVPIVDVRNLIGIHRKEPAGMEYLLLAATTRVGSDIDHVEQRSSEDYASENL